MAQPEKVLCPLCDVEVEAFDLAEHKWDVHPEAAIRDEQERNDRKRPFNRTTKFTDAVKNEDEEQPEGVLDVHAELTVQSEQNEEEQGVSAGGS